MPMYGFIGLGAMGARMSANLVRKVVPSKVNVFDTNPKAVAQLQSLGALSVKGPKEIAAGSQVIVTMLPSAKIVEEVYCGKDGLLSSVQKDTVLIDCSTIDVDTPRRLKKEIEGMKKGLTFVDAPVSGGVAAAEAGTLTFLVGGSAEDYAKVQPTLAHMGKAVMHCGQTGAGQAVKIANNLALGICMGAIAEAMLLGTRLGVDPKILAQAINNATGRCWSSDSYNPYPGIIPTVAASKGYQPGFAVDLMLKDLRLASAAAQGVKLNAPLCKRAEEVFTDVSKKGLGNMDFSIVLKFLDESSK